MFKRNAQEKSKALPFFFVTFFIKLQVSNRKTFGSYLLVCTTYTSTVADFIIIHNSNIVVSLMYETNWRLVTSRYNYLHKWY